VFDARTGNQLYSFFAYGANFTGGGEPERLQGLRVSGNAFQTLGTDAFIGRTLTSEDDRPDSPKVAVLGYGLWQRRFGGDQNIVGRKVIMGAAENTIIGVLPPGDVLQRLNAKDAVADVPVPPLPPAIRNRRKTGFVTPVGRWLRDAAGAPAHEGVDFSAASRSWALRVWRSGWTGPAVA